MELGREAKQVLTGRGRPIQWWQPVLGAGDGCICIGRGRSYFPFNVQGEAPASAEAARQGRWPCAMIPTSWKQSGAGW